MKWVKGESSGSYYAIVTLHSENLDGNKICSNFAGLIIDSGYLTNSTYIWIR